MTERPFDTDRGVGPVGARHVWATMRSAELGACFISVEAGARTAATAARWGFVIGCATMLARVVATSLSSAFLSQ
jgi:hypothetical protein